MYYKFLQVTTSEIFLGKNELSKSLAERLAVAHRFKNLHELINEESKNPFFRLCVLTFSPV